MRRNPAKDSHGTMKPSLKMDNPALVGEYSEDSCEPQLIAPCQHNTARDVGQGFDDDGNLVRLRRCEQCGLLMSEYIML